MDIDNFEKSLGVIEWTDEEMINILDCLCKSIVDHENAHPKLARALAKRFYDWLSFGNNRKKRNANLYEISKYLSHGGGLSIRSLGVVLTA